MTRSSEGAVDGPKLLEQLAAGRVVVEFGLGEEDPEEEGGNGGRDDEQQITPPAEGHLEGSRLD